MVFHSKYEIDDLTEIIKELAIEALSAGQSRFTAVTKKFATSRLMRASTFLQKRLSILRQIASESSQWHVLRWTVYGLGQRATILIICKICLKGILISDMWILLQNVFFLMISKGMISKGFVIMANHCSLWFKHFFIVCNFNFWGFCYRQGNFFERSFWGKFLLFCWQLTNIEVIVSPSKLRIIILMLYVMCYARKKCYILVTITETLWHVSTCKVMRTLVF